MGRRDVPREMSMRVMEESGRDESRPYEFINYRL